MITGLRRRFADDTGASLILAIAFMTFLGLVVGSLLTYTGTSLRSTNATEVRAKAVYDIDGALQAAVNQVRTDGTFTNAAGQPCPDLSFPGPNTGLPVMVKCVGGKETGAAGGAVAITPANRPERAVLTLGTGAETGIDKGDDNLLLVRGDVYVNGTAASISQAGTDCAATPWPPTPGVDCSGVGVDNGTLTARGTCNGTIVAPGGKSCSSPAPPVADPGYPQPNTWAYQAVPACPGGPTVTFEPGYYDDAVALSRLTDGVSCKNRVMHFKPGTYYFDFHNGDGAPLPAGAHVWTIKDATTDVVGGMPKGWTPAGGNPTIPGACVSPLDSAANGGVQFVFGGDSRLDVKAGNVELCGQYTTGRPPIAIYGARTGADPSPTTATEKADDAASTTDPPFTSLERIVEEGDGPSEAEMTAGADDVTSEVTVKGFTPPNLPAGVILTKAELVAVHRTQSTDGSILKQLQVMYGSTRGGATQNSHALTPAPPPAAGGYHVDKIDVTDKLADEVHRHGLDGLQVTYSATVAAGESVTEQIEAIQLNLTWRSPAVRGQTVAVSGGPNCVGIVGAGGCAMIKTKPPNTKFYVQGTAYAPLAHMDLELDGVSAPVFLVGIIVRALKVHLHATSALSRRAMIEVPDPAAGGPPKPLEVYFRAYTCPAGVTCANPAPAAPWRLSGTAHARYVDPDIFAPAPPYDTVTVLGWTVRRT